MNNTQKTIGVVALGYRVVSGKPETAGPFPALLDYACDVAAKGPGKKFNRRRGFNATAVDRDGEVVVLLSYNCGIHEAFDDRVWCVWIPASVVESSGLIRAAA